MAHPTPKEDDQASTSDPHRMRITSAGSITSYVRFALSFLQANPDRSLILHTKPSSDIVPDTNAKPTASSSTLTPSLLNTPKLISVIEIIKREHLNRLAISEKGKGKNRATGIWQYTETGLLPIPTTTAEAGDGDALVRALEGKTKPKMTHNPYLQVTLSTKPLGLEAGIGVTCQYVLASRRRNREKEKGKGEIDSKRKGPVASKDGERSSDGQVDEEMDVNDSKGPATGSRKQGSGPAAKPQTDKSNGFKGSNGKRKQSASSQEARGGTKRSKPQKLDKAAG